MSLFQWDVLYVVDFTKKKGNSYFHVEADCPANGAKTVCCAHKKRKTAGEAWSNLLCVSLLSALSLSRSLSSILGPLGLYCSEKLLRNPLPCAIRPSPRSNMLSTCNQSPYLAVCFFEEEEEVETYSTPYLYRKKNTSQCNNVRFMHHSAPNGVQTSELLT